jgi:hypothetical protein
MLDAFLLKVFLHLKVLELRTVVTSYFLFLIRTHFELLLRSSWESLGFRFILQKEYPSEARKVINYNKTLLTSFDAKISNGSKETHMKKLQWS